MIALFLVASNALGLEAQERRWVENRDPKSGSMMFETELVREFVYMSDGLRLGEVVASQIVQRYVKSETDGNSYRRELYVTLFAVEDLTNSMPGRRFRGFLDWGFCGPFENECADYVPLTDAVGPMAFESSDYGGKVPNAQARCFDSLDSFYELGIQGGERCWRRTMRTLVAGGFVEYDRFMSRAARFDPAHHRIALRLLDDEDEYFFLTMGMTGLLDGLELAVRD